MYLEASIAAAVALDLKKNMKRSARKAGTGWSNYVVCTITPPMLYVDTHKNLGKAHSSSSSNLLSS